MRALFIVVAAVLLSAAAKAAEPVVTNDIPHGAIMIGLDEVKRLTFPESVESIRIGTENIVSIVPKTDRLFIVQGLSTGSTAVFAYGPDKKLIYSGTFQVNKKPGHVVKIYRMTPRANASESSRATDPGREDAYSSIWCTETGCEQAAKSMRPDQPGGF